MLTRLVYRFVFAKCIQLDGWGTWDGRASNFGQRIVWIHPDIVRVTPPLTHHALKAF